MIIRLLKTTSCFALALMMLSACGPASESASETSSADTSTSALKTANTGALPPGCFKTEGSGLGKTGTGFSVGDATVTYTSWMTKTDGGNEYIGFTYTVSGGSVSVSVKAGTTVFTADGTGSWVNPNGTSGPDASAISNVVFCPSTTPPPPPGPGTTPCGGACTTTTDCESGLQCIASVCTLT